MAGLFGYFTQHELWNAPQVVARMGETMRHHDYYRIDTAPAGRSGALGRLGIGLLNRSPQPVWGADGEVALVLCGELYHQERRRAELESSGRLMREADDAELALRLYLGDGVDALAALEGMFVIAVWDGRTGELWLVNDRYGLYPHYYAHVGSAFAFAPEIKGVLAIPRMPRVLDMVAVAQYTRFQQLMGERTWFEDVQLLPPATMLRYRPADAYLDLRRYWDWDQINLQSASIGLDEAAEETIRLFQRAIDAMVRPPLRVGIFLSGGLDGRAILGCARDRADVTTLTFGDPASRDVRYAAQLAHRAGSGHHSFPLHDGRWVLDHAEEHLTLTEGLHSWMHAHGISILPAARQLVDVNLSGWDGGTILGGYTAAPGTDGRFRHAPDETTLAQRLFAAFCSEFAWPGLTDYEAEALFSPPGEETLRGLAFDSLRDELARTAHYPTPNRADYFYILQHCRRSTQNMIVFARSAVETRCPFFDYEFVSFLYGLPERLRSSLDLQHRVLTLRMPDLARIPNEKDNLPPHSSRALRLGHRAVGRGRRAVNRFVPLFPERPRLYADYENYLRGELADWAEGILLNPRTLERGLFNPDAVRDLWALHQSGDQLWTIGKIAPLMTLELVLRRLYDECDASDSRL